MSGRVVIHIGLDKTGTSAIQSFFLKNRQSLLDSGVDYTLIGLHRPGNGHHILSHKWGGWLDISKLDVDPEVAWADLARACARSDKTIVISSERFTGVSAHRNFDEHLQFIAEKLKDSHVTIVGYVRRQDALAESYFKQGVRGKSHNLTIKDYIQDLPPQFDFLMLFNRWAKIFGEVNVRARLYSHRVFKNSDLIQDFFATAELPFPKDPDYSASFANPSLSAMCAKLLTQPELRSLTGHQKFRQAAIDQIGNYVSEVNSQNTLLCESDRLRIMERYESSNRIFSSRYLDRLSSEILAAPPQNHDGCFDPDIPSLSYSQVVRLFKSLVE